MTMYIGKKLLARGLELNVPTPQEIKAKLQVNDAWVFGAIKAIYDNQTDTEQTVGHTIEDNGIGFSGCDAEILSSFAEQIIQRGSLSQKQMVYARKKISKYSKQLWMVAYRRAKLTQGNDQ